MRELSNEAMDKLDALYLEEYLDTCVEDLKEIGYEQPFPSEQKDYKAFVVHVHHVASKYGLDNEKYVFALILAWHVRGQEFPNEKRVVNLLNSQTLTPHTKYQELMKITMETLDAYIENEKEITDEQ